MVYVELHCRLGNLLFQLAAAETLALQNDTKAYCYIADENVPEGTLNDYIANFQNTIFRNVNFVDTLPEKTVTLKWKQFEFKSFPRIETNVILSGAFQSFKYFDETLIKRLFAPSLEIIDYINSKYGNLLKDEVTAIHIRRGDYMEIPHKFPVCSLSYFRKAIKLIGGSKFLIISDDIAWCKLNFKGINFYFSENEDALVDLYLISLCKNVIMSNSSFSWWGAYLNHNKDKKVIVPKNWFGISKETNKHNTKDLTPPDWIKIQNKMEYALQLKAWKMNIKEILLEARDKIKDFKKNKFKLQNFNQKKH